jgi:hypothetical protein
MSLDVPLDQVDDILKSLVVYDDGGTSGEVNIQGQRAALLKITREPQEGVFKAILGNCQAVVNNLGAIRNRVGDAHGQGRRPVKPKARHAELAVPRSLRTHEISGSLRSSRDEL